MVNLPSYLFSQAKNAEKPEISGRYSFLVYDYRSYRFIVAIMGNVRSKYEKLKSMKEKDEKERRKIQEVLRKKRKLVDEQENEIQVDTAPVVLA